MRADQSRSKKRLIFAIGAVLVVVITVVAVLQLSPGDDPVEEAAAATPTPTRAATATELTNEFLDAFTSGNAGVAGALTDNETAATATLTEVWRALGPNSVAADRTALVAPAADATTADEPFELTWDLGPERFWSYDSALRIVKNEAGWRVQWQPTIVHPRLSAGHTLALRDRTGQPAVLDRDGAPLLTWAPSGPAAAEPAVAPILLPAMGRIVGGTGGTDGWAVALVDGAGAEVEVLSGSKAAVLTATLSRPVQQAAQAAVDTQQLPTVLVAMQPSTGELLAVAQNAAAGKDPIALNGLYPPGSTFKIATATAIVEAGVADVGTVVPCPGQATIGQRTVRNAGFELGDVPLRTAFARSCNTTFAMQAANLSPDSLPNAASQLGLGADFDIPGIVTEAGNVPAAANTTEQVENSIGQGTVQASCFGLALMTSTVAAGKAVTPKLWREMETTVSVGYEPPPANVIRSVRTMMRDVVTGGRATALARYGPVYGKTGTAQVDDGTNAHGWFTGYRDDVAFATLVLNGETSGTAVTVTGAFLGALPR